MSSDGDAIAVSHQSARVGDAQASAEARSGGGCSSPWLLALVVEDRLSERTAIRMALRSLAVDSIWARTTLEAHLHLVRQGREIDVIIVDLGISQADIPSFCRSIRSERLLTGMPIVLMGSDTATPEPEAFSLPELVLRSGGPFDERGVADAIENLRSQRLVRITHDR